MAIFPHNRGLPKTEAKREIYRQYRRGDSVQALAQRFCRSPSRIYRIVNEMRAAQIMELPLDYIGNEQFARLRSQKKEAEILGPLPESDLPTKKPRLPSDLPAYLASLYEVPLLTREQETHLFRKMNYLKYKASALRAQLDVNQPKSRLMDRIEKLYDESVATKNQIIRANLRLVVSIAKRYVGPAGDFFEFVSDGNMSLMQGGGEVRCLAGLQVQHVRELGDHEEFLPHNPRRASSSGPFLHQPIGDVQRRRGRPRRLL